jgi:hypothetical protein
MPGTQVIPAVRRGSKVRRAGPLAVALAAAVVSAGCSSGPASPGVAAASNSAAPSSSSTATGALAYSECMRAHGIPNFPDPNSNGGIEFNGSGINQATYEAAQRACAGLRGGGSANASSPQNLANELKFAKCMRAHGVADFPDPNSNGGFSGSGGTGPGGVDPAAPAFQNAQSICFKQQGAGGSS